MTMSAKIAGTTVMPNGPGPGRRSKRSPKPQTTSAAMYTAYMRIRNASVLSATLRGDMPERRSAQAVSAMPPAPPAANSRVAARPAIVIW